MIRLFLSPEELTSQEIVIHGENAHYISSVLRVQTGDMLTIFDGQGNRYICMINKIHKKEVIVEKIKKEAYSAESPILIALAQGIPKGDKMDFIVQKSTEIGVKKIIPLITERSQVQHTAKTERWRKIALSASQQSGREKIPDIEEPITFENFLKKNEFYHPPLHPLPSRDGTSEAASHLCGRDSLIPSPLVAMARRGEGKGEGQIGIIFSEEEKNQTLKKVLKDFKEITAIILLIGPEGGFSDTETKMAVEKGFTATSLGPRILRTETAALSAISIVQYELGDMG